MSKWLGLAGKTTKRVSASARGGNSAPPTKLVRLGHDYWNWEDYASAKRRAQSQNSPLCEGNPPADEFKGLGGGQHCYGIF